MNKLVIFGASAFAEIADYYFTHDSPFRVHAFTVDGQYVKAPTYLGRPVIAFEEIERAFPPSKYDMFIALGIREVNALRARKCAEARARGYRLASFLSSKADVAADQVLKPNTMIMERAGIQPFTSIGEDVIIWSGTRIGFHGKIGDHSWLTCPLLGESVTVGEASFLGLNSVIAPFVSIGKRNIIGAGALITRDTTDNQVYKGEPSRPSRVPSDRLRGFGSH